MIRKKLNNFLVSFTFSNRPNDDTTYGITCGNIQGELIWKKFVCPGINAKCVKVSFLD